MSLPEWFDLAVFCVLVIQTATLIRMKRWGGHTHNSIVDLQRAAVQLRTRLYDLREFQHSIEDGHPDIQEHIDQRNRLVAQIERDFMNITALDVRLNAIDHNWELTNAKVNGLESRYRKLIGEDHE